MSSPLVDKDGELVECLDSGPDPSDCEGPVEYRYPLSSSNRWFPRCEKHWHERLERQAEIDARYPAQQPADFDPMYAGERWDDDY